MDAVNALLLLLLCETTLTLYRECPSEDLNDRAVKEVFAEHGGVNGGRHEDYPYLWVGLDHVPQNHHQEVSLARTEHTL